MERDGKLEGDHKQSTFGANFLPRRRVYIFEDRLRKFHDRSLENQREENRTKKGLRAGRKIKSTDEVYKFIYSLYRRTKKIIDFVVHCA